jgi:hypothetical protein
MPNIAEHVFEIIDYPTTGTHAIARNDNGWLGCSGQAVDHSQMSLVTVYRQQVIETSGLRPQRRRIQRRC